jgi:hypothetical protein
MGQRAEELLARVEDRVVHDILVDLTARLRELEVTVNGLVVARQRLLERPVEGG